MKNLHLESLRSLSPPSLVLESNWNPTRKKNYSILTTVNMEESVGCDIVFGSVHVFSASCDQPSP